MRVFLSFNSLDGDLARQLRSELLRVEPSLDIFYSPISLQSGFWLPKLAEAISETDAFILLIGPNKLGPWQRIEYHEAFDRHAKDASFPLVPVICRTSEMPGLPFLRQLNWVDAPDVADDAVLHRLLAVLNGMPPETAPPLWKLVNPYRGLVAMREENSDYFCGRSTETAAVLEHIASSDEVFPILIGASGVGKSSVAQAGALASLRSMRWPGASDARAGADAWPARLKGSRSWALLTLVPGSAPVDALVNAFTRLWSLDQTDPRSASIRRRWSRRLSSNANTLADLIDATQERVRANEGAAPDTFLLYVDQLEELYTQARAGEDERFSALVREGLSDVRLRAFGSMRADYLGRLQADRGLFPCHRQINVPPLDAARLEEVVTGPAARLGVSFEESVLPGRLVDAALRSAGALPLLSYLLTDAWGRMTDRGDGVIRLSSQAIDVGGVLRARAEEFLAKVPGQEDALRKLLTLKLAIVPPEGAPLKREARKAECPDDLWRLACLLADHPWRLVVVSEHDAGRGPVAELAHEALLRGWPRLGGWLREERDFLVFKYEIERRALDWNKAGKPAGSLLLGLDLARAKAFLPRGGELAPEAQELAGTSIAAERNRARREVRRALSVAAAMTVLAGVAAFGGAVAYLAQRAAGESLARAQRTESVFLADAAAQERLSGDAGTGILLSLAGLPDPASGRARPLVPRAELELDRSLAELREVAIFGHDGPVRRVAADGSGRFASAVDNVAQVWSAVPGSRPVTLAGHSDTVYAVAFSPDGTRVATASADRTACIWRSAGGPCAMVIELDGVGLNVAFRPDGRAVAIVSSDGFARIRDVETGAALADLEAHAGPLTSVAFDRSGRLLLTGGEDGRARLWDLARTDAPLHVFEHGAEPVTGVDLTPDGRRALTAGQDGAVRVWDCVSGEPLPVPPVPETGPISDARFMPDGERALVAAGRIASIRRLRGGNGPAVALAGHAERVASAVATSAGSILTASDDGTVRLWREPDAASGRQRLPHDRPVRSIGFRPDGQRLVSGAENGSVRVWDLASGQPVGEAYAGHRRAVMSATYSPDGEAIVTTSEDGTAVLRDGRGGPSKPLAGHRGPVWIAAFSPSGSLIVTGSDDRRLRVFDARSGASLREPIDHGASVRALAFNPNGRTLAVGMTNGALRLLDAETFKPAGQPVLLSASVRSLEFLRDGQGLVATLANGSVEVWDVGLLGKLLSFSDGQHLRAGTLTPDDGGRLATVSEDGGGVIKLQTLEGELVRHAEAIGSVVSALRFSPDGRRLAAAASDLAVHVLAVPTSAALVERAKSVVPRCLTGPQRTRYLLDAASEPWCPSAGKWIGPPPQRLAVGGG